MKMLHQDCLGYHKSPDGWSLSVESMYPTEDSGNILTQ